MTQGYLQIHLSIQNQCLVADANMYIVTIGFFHTNWSFAGNAKITGENSSVETTCSGNGNSGRFPGTQRPASSELASDIKD